MIETLDITGWHDAIDGATRDRAVHALERGAVLFFPRLRFDLGNDEVRFLDPAVSNGKAKNISLNPATGKLQATSLAGADAAALGAMIECFGASATKLVEELLPYRHVERARTSFRPVEVEGRHYSKTSDDRLLHVDAFPSRPMQKGRRILRFFCNVAPLDYGRRGERHWLVGQDFENFAQAFLPRAKTHTPGKSWLWEKLGVTHGRRSRYDEMMLSLHDAAKLDDAFQKNCPKTALDFPPGSCWLVYTDQVLHAALGGAFALEQTFHLDLAQMVEPARSPFHILERLSGKTLA
ncbi:MAG: Kdo hydroxylase family protein [Alphaproteobacteria bacterium]|nr:Kdo hydroxylase family protein [Alphaproteobacteria bacterium]